MNRHYEPRSLSALLSGVVLCLCMTSCGTGEQTPKDRTEPASDTPTNRIDIPQAVRKNLGIEFTKVERRHVTATLRLPAQVELLPSATQHYRAPLAGRVSLKVDPLQKVKAGDLLYTLDSHEWRDLQRELGSVTNTLTVTEAQLESMSPLAAACGEHERSLVEAHQVTTSYVESLQRAEAKVGGQGEKLANARVDQAKLSAQIAEASEKHTVTQTRIKELTAQLASQREQIDLLLSGAAATLNVDKATLAATTAGKVGWRTLAVVEVRATQTGVVDQIETANGDLVDRHGAVLHTVDPSKVRCHARALQSDLGDLRDGLQATVVPVGKITTSARVAATILLGPSGDARTRTLDVFAMPTDKELQFVRPGMAVFVEVVTATSKSRELAIPKSCVLPDGLHRVFFRRDPKNKDKVIRIVGDFGRDNGQWIEVLSGVKDGDEIVAAGAFELVLASSDTMAKGGHFHADGTWHADGEDHE
ncbi:MAG: hypothetical protein ACI89X_001247 [Planctomycetota bacterium]|jgi:hypothetical protein